MKFLIQMLLCIAIFQPTFSMEVVELKEKIELEYSSFGNFLDTVLSPDKKPSKRKAGSTAAKKAEQLAIKKELEERQVLLQKKQELEDELARLTEIQALRKQQGEELLKKALQTQQELNKEKQEALALREQYEKTRAIQKKEAQIAESAMLSKKNVPITKKEQEQGMNFLIKNYQDCGINNKKTLATHLRNVTYNLCNYSDLNDTKKGPCFIIKTHLLWGGINKDLFYLFSPCTKKFIIEKYKSNLDELTDNDVIECSNIMCDIDTCKNYTEIKTRIVKGRIL